MEGWRGRENAGSEDVEVGYKDFWGRAGRSRSGSAVGGTSFKV